MCPLTVVVYLPQIQKRRAIFLLLFKPVMQAKSLDKLHAPGHNYRNINVWKTACSEQLKYLASALMWVVESLDLTYKTRPWRKSSVIYFKFCLHVFNTLCNIQVKEMLILFSLVVCERKQREYRVLVNPTGWRWVGPTLLLFIAEQNLHCILSFLRDTISSSSVGYKNKCRSWSFPFPSETHSIREYPTAYNNFLNQ